MCRSSNHLAKQVHSKIVVLLMSARRLAIILLAVSFTNLAYGNKYAAKPVVIMEGSNNMSRICLYEGKAFSLGAVILVGGVYLDCVPEKNVETSGRLKWEKIILDPKEED